MEYSIEIKNSRMEIVKEAMDGGKLEIYTVGYGVLLVSINFGSPAAVVVDGSLDIIGLPLAGMAGNSGTAMEAAFVDSLGQIILGDLSVGLSGTNIVLDNLDIILGQTVNLLSGTIIHG